MMSCLLLAQISRGVFARHSRGRLLARAPTGIGKTPQFVYQVYASTYEKLAPVGYQLQARFSYTRTCDGARAMPLNSDIPNLVSVYLMLAQ